MLRKVYCGASIVCSFCWFCRCWQRHVLAAGQSRMINCAMIGNEIVLASEFSNEARNSIGLVSVLRPGSDPLKPRTATEIDRLPTSHRLRVADLFGDGHPVVVNAALTGASATPPDYPIKPRSFIRAPANGSGT